MSSIHFAVIGTREPTPAQVNLCKWTVAWFCKKHPTTAVLHTGGAPGIDQIAARKALRCGATVVLHLPWYSFEEKFVARWKERYPTKIVTKVIDPISDKTAWESVDTYHPNSAALGSGGRRLHARNYRIVYPGTKSVSFVLAFPSPGGGGTAQGIRIATKNNIPLITSRDLPSIKHQIKKARRNAEV